MICSQISFINYTDDTILSSPIQQQHIINIITLQTTQTFTVGDLYEYKITNLYNQRQKALRVGYIKLTVTGSNCVGITNINLMNILAFIRINSAGIV